MNKRLSFALVSLVGCVGVDNSQGKLRTAVDAQRDPLFRCYSQALVNDAEMEGMMRLVIRVPRRTDRVDLVEPSGESQLTNPGLMEPVHRCFQRALMGLAIGGAPIDDDLYVEYAFQLTRDGNTAFLAPATTGPRVGVRVDANANVNVDVRNGRVKGNVEVKGGFGIR